MNKKGFIFNKILRFSRKKSSKKNFIHDFYTPKELDNLGLYDWKKDKIKKKSKDLTALVVDDDINISKLIKSWLEVKGFVVFVANNGLDAVKLLENDSFDLITTDILMPEFDGIKLINYIKSNPNLYNIPVIVLSILDKSDIGNFFADAYIKKPFDGFDLLKTVDELM